MSDEPAGTGKEIAKAVIKGLELLDKAGTLQKAQAFVGKVIGTPVENIVGLFISDPLVYLRVLALGYYNDRVEKILDARGVKDPKPVSPSVAIPLIEGASSETREELQDLWAKLIASAMDPARSKHVRLELIDAVKRMAPADALILKIRHDNHGHLTPGTVKYLADILSLDMDEVQISLTSLINVGLMIAPGGGRDFQYSDAVLSPLGRELMRIVA
jgi:hypothetical protein